MGKKRRVENADLDQEGDEEETVAGADGAKRRKREAELQRQVEEYTVRLYRWIFIFGVIIIIIIFLTLNNTSDRIVVRRCSKHTRRRMRSARKTRRRSQLGYGITRVIWGWAGG